MSTLVEIYKLCKEIEIKGEFNDNVTPGYICKLLENLNYNFKVIISPTDVIDNNYKNLKVRHFFTFKNGKTLFTAYDCEGCKECIYDNRLSL